MKKLKIKTVASWVLQIISVFILLPAAWSKISGAEEARALFTNLGMEPIGRIFIGNIEFIICFGYLIDKVAVISALLTICIMIGALIAHLTKVGIEVNGDGGSLFYLLLSLMTFAFLIIAIRRKELPFFSKHFL